jgi:stage II sporulation protein AA (anti-sigma F factor antagonist)
MKITEQRQGAVLVLKPDGALVEQECASFKAKLAEATGASLGRFVLDLSAVPFVDSRGLEALVEATEELGKSGQALRLCAVNKTIREVFDLTDLTNLFEHFEDANTAVRSFL